MKLMQLIADEAQVDGIFIIRGASVETTKLVKEIAAVAQRSDPSAR